MDDELSRLKAGLKKIENKRGTTLESVGDAGTYFGGAQDAFNECAAIATEALAAITTPKPKDQA